MKIEDIKKMAQAWNQVQEASYGKPKKEASDTQMGTITIKTDAERKARAQAYRDKKAATNEAMDPVDAKELKGKHKDRKDKDIDNDGKVDSTDKYLHKRRKAVSKAIKGKGTEVETEVQEEVEELDEDLEMVKKEKDPKGGYIVTLKDKKGKLIKRHLKNGKVTDMKEAKDHGNMNNGSKAGEGLSPSAKKELARTTPMPDAVNEPVVDKKTFDAIRASGKKAPMRSNDNAAGDKTAPKAGK